MDADTYEKLVCTIMNRAQEDFPFLETLAQLYADKFTDRSAKRFIEEEN